MLIQWLRTQTTEFLIKVRNNLVGELRSDIDAELKRRGKL